MRYVHASLSSFLICQTCEFKRRFMSLKIFPLMFDETWWEISNTLDRRKLIKIYCDEREFFNKLKCAVSV